MDLEAEIVDEISGIQVGSGYYATTIGIDAAREAAAELLPLVKRAQAEAWDEGMAYGVNYDAGDYEVAPEPITNPYREGGRS